MEAETLTTKESITVSENTAESFPLKIYPEFLQEYCRKLSDSTGLPLDYVAGSVLVAVSAAVGKRIKLKVKNFSTAPSLYLCLVGKSGLGKTDPIRWALAPLLKIDHKEIQNYRQQFKEWNNEKENSSDEPKQRQRIITDFTPESMYQLLAAGNDLTVYRDEILGFVNDFERYNRSGTEKTFLSIWSQTEVRVNRKKDLPISIENPFVSIIGGIQPDLLSQFITPDRSVSGFAQRFLYIFPEDQSFKDFSEEEVSEKLKQYYNEFIYKCLTVEGKGMNFDQEEKEINFSPEALDIYKKFFSRNTKRKNESDDIYSTFYAKFDIYFPRFATLIEVINTVSNLQPENIGRIYDISEESASRAAILSEYFISQLDRIIPLLNTPRDGFDRKKKIIEIFQACKNQSLTARVLNVTQQYVSKVLHEAGVIGSGETVLNNKSCMDV